MVVKSDGGGLSTKRCARQKCHLVTERVAVTVTRSFIHFKNLAILINVKGKVSRHICTNKYQEMKGIIVPERMCPVHMVNFV